MFESPLNYNSESDDELLEQLSDWESVKADLILCRKRSYEKRIDYMNKLADNEFTYRFRLNKIGVNDLLSEIYPFLKVTSKR